MGGIVTPNLSATEAAMLKAVPFEASGMAMKPKLNTTSAGKREA